LFTEKEHFQRAFLSAPCRLEFIAESLSLANFPTDWWGIGDGYRVSGRVFFEPNSVEISQLLRSDRSTRNLGLAIGPGNS
jgi:hypothetical protein